MKGSCLAAVAALACTMVFTGCATNPPLPPTDTRVTIAADLAADVQVLGLKCVRTASGHLELQSTLLNRTPGECGIEWQVTWLSADGLEIPSAVSNWAKRMLPPNDVVGMRNTASSKDAVDFRLHLRKLRR